MVLLYAKKVFLTAALTRFITATATGITVATTCWSVSCPAAADTALLRVTGQGDAAEFNCPTPKARRLATRSTAEMSGWTELDAQPLRMTPTPTPKPTPTPPADAYPTALKIGLWGDSHTASGTCADSLLQAFRLPLAHTHPSFVAPTFGLKGVRQPLRRACLNEDFKVGLYEQLISASLSRLKASYPRARCILNGPPDAQRLSNTLRLINDSPYRLALAQGCAHWNWQKAMGGTGAAQRWLAKGWMQADLLHLTPEAYAQSARSLVSMVPIKPR